VANVEKEEKEFKMLPCPFCKEPWHSSGQWLKPATIKQQPINVGETAMS